VAGLGQGIRIKKIQNQNSKIQNVMACQFAGLAAINETT
jgi:selenocysteine-specific translation elongation factor